MIKFRSVVCIGLFALSACSEQDKSVTPLSDSNEWELRIVDSIQVDYLGDIRGGYFSEGIGLIKNISGNHLIKFDSLGTILVKKEFPQEGPGSVMWLESLVQHDGEYFGTTSFNDMYHFDEDLNLKERLIMPFTGESRGGAYNRKDIAVWKESILLWYPGRDGVSPYMDHFYRDYPLLELYDPHTGTSLPVVRTPPTSKFSTDEFFGRPTVNFTLQNDSLYLTFSNEPILHVYAMGDSVRWVRSMDMGPTDFKVLPGQRTPVTYQEMIKMNEAQIYGMFSDPNHVMVTYFGGIDSETFVNNNLKERENFSRYPEFRKNYLKIYRPGTGWSNEVLIPSEVKLILNIESVEKPFYALRDDDFVGQEQDYLTFYKLQLVAK